jgi:biotin transport system substrate-specific component
MSNRMLQMRRAATLEVVEHVNTRRALAVVAFAVMTGLSAYAEVRLPGIPVPVTLQTLFVSLAGLMLGAQLGAVAMAMYVTAGAAGLPVFAGGALGLPYLFGPTGGYLLAFPLAAYVTGALAARVPADGNALNVVRLWVAVLLGTLVVFAGGAAQLAALIGDPVRAVQLGVLPFLVGDVVKVSAAVLIAGRLRSRSLRRLQD